MNLWKPWYVYRPMQLVRRLWRDLRGGSGPRVVTLPWGQPLRIDPAQLIGKSIWRTGVFELLVSEVLFRLVEPGETVVDVGANIGYMAGILGLAAGPTGTLHAVEPHPQVYACLEDNLGRCARHGGMARVRLHACALGGEAGVADLFLPESFGGNDGAASMADDQSHRPSVKVPVVRLDDLFAGGKIGVLKIDVEGYEENVLRGAAGMLRTKSIRDVVYEDHVGPASPPSRLLAEAGYTLYRLEGTMRGLKIVPAGVAPTKPATESPSYLATCDPARAEGRCHGKGWRALGAA